MADQLPPWLTRQYDYAGGFRGIGHGYAQGVQNNALQQQMAQRQQEINDAAETQAMRNQGIANYQRDFAQIMKERGGDPQDAAIQAYVANAHLIDPKGFGRTLATEEGNRFRQDAADLQSQFKLLQAQTAADRLQADIKAKQATLDNLKAIAEGKNATTIKKAEIETGGRKDIEASRDKRIREISENKFDTQIQLGEMNDSRYRDIAADKNETDLKRTQILNESREKIQQEKAKAGAPGGRKPGAAENQALGFAEARAKLKAALDSGDADKIEEAENFLNDMKAGAAAMHPDRTDSAELGVLVSRIKNIDRMMAKPGNLDAFPDLPKQRDRLINELQNFNKRKKASETPVPESGDTGPSSHTPAPAENAPGPVTPAPVVTEGEKTGRGTTLFKPGQLPKKLEEGQTVIFKGKAYRYIGGPINDPDSYAEIVGAVAPQREYGPGAPIK